MSFSVCFWVTNLVLEVQEYSGPRRGLRRTVEEVDQTIVFGTVTWDLCGLSVTDILSE